MRWESEIANKKACSYGNGDSFTQVHLVPTLLSGQGEGYYYYELVEDSSVPVSSMMIVS